MEEGASAEGGAVETVVIACGLGVGDDDAGGSGEVGGDGGPVEKVG